MANQLVATYLVVNGVNMSGFIQTCNAPESTDMEDDGVMTDTSKSSRPGLNDCNITIEGVQDHAAGGPEQTLSALKGNATGFPIEWRPTGAAVSSTNPKRTATFVLENYDPLSGTKGKLAMFKATFRPGGSAPDVVRATS